MSLLQIRRYLGLGKSGTSSVPPLVLAASLAEDWKRSAAFRPGCERNIGVRALLLQYIDELRRLAFPSL